MTAPGTGSPAAMARDVRALAGTTPLPQALRAEAGFHIDAAGALLSAYAHQTDTPDPSAIDAADALDAAGAALAWARVAQEESNA